MVKCDFSGYATRNDLKCGDGRTIRRNAFVGNDGDKVPLVWNHEHNNIDAVLGHALLENRDDGVYAYCTFNDSESGRAAKELVAHGDVTALSIYANQLKHVGNDVVHGNIRELSLVLAGANPGAYIDYTMAHGDDEEDTLTANYDERIVIYHSDELSKKKDGKEKEMQEPEKKETEKTVQDVIDSMTEEQRTVMYALIGELIEDYENDKEDRKGDEEVKHNLFEPNDRVDNDTILSHADEEGIIVAAKDLGSFQKALFAYAEDNDLQHDGISGFDRIEPLFPEYKDVRPGAPELITSDQGWITTVIAKVHKSPISRIRTSQVDIRNIGAIRAKGYKKGNSKKNAGNIKLIRRTTDPQTVYVKNALHRDDIVDITDFDYVQYLYNIDKMMLNEELATAIMIGDGRDDGDDDKIDPSHIRPIWTDDDLYTIHADLDMDEAKKELQGTNTSANFGDNYVYAEAIINTVLYTRERFKGTGTPDFYCTPHLLNVMLLARDINGRRIYSSKAELASSLNVGDIITAEQFEGKQRTVENGAKKELLGIICNLSDYSLGATKGGEINHFTDFDIDFNQQKSLLETRCSGALTRVYSAIALEKPVDSTEA